MEPNSQEEVRFAAILNSRLRLGSIAHLPHGDTSFFVATLAPYPPVLLAYRIFLPYHWPDAQRIRETAFYLARIELGIWQRSALDRVVGHVDMGRQEDITALELADRLIAPRPWVEDIVQRYGSRRRTLKQAAKELCIPVESIDTVLHAQSSQAADSAHRHIKEVTGYPWFLPTHLRDCYPADRW